MMAANSHILVCDDETHLREMVGEYLAERGYRITEVPDAQSLHEAMANEPADLIVLDINMPGEDGLTALRVLRSRSDVPVMMIRRKGQSGQRAWVLSHNANWIWMGHGFSAPMKTKLPSRQWSSTCCVSSTRTSGVSSIAISCLNRRMIAAGSPMTAR